MASSTIHLAITNELIKRHRFQDPNRLKFGSVLPDAGTKGDSHLKVFIWGLHKRTYDLDFFRERFGSLMKQDDLYLGYYLHLVQDLCFRHYLYDRHHWNPSIPGNVDKLHRDYAIGNSYIIHRYRLCNDLVIPDQFEKEALNELCQFDIKWLLQSIGEYFEPVEDDGIFFFTREMTDEYIAEAVKLCLKEMEALSCGKGFIDSYDNGWDNEPKSLLETTFNTRELGTYRVDGTKIYTKPGRILRSDVVKQPSKKDIDFLRKRELTTIIDLRSQKETEESPHGLANVEGFSYHHIPIDEGSGVPERAEAVPKSYLAIAESRNISRVFLCMTEAEHGILFHCTAGKDRTGVVAALVLWLCKVRHSDIVYDYMITRKCMQPRFEAIHQKFPEMDMNIVIPSERNIKEFLRLISEKYGMIENYYLSIGITEELQKKLTNHLLK